MTSNITEEELQKAITDALVSSTPGFNKGETSAPNEAKKHKIPLTRARKILQELCDVGIIEKAWVKFTNGWEETSKIKGYRLKGE